MDPAAADPTPSVRKSRPPPNGAVAVDLSPAASAGPPAMSSPPAAGGGLTLSSPTGTAASSPRSKGMRRAGQPSSLSPSAVSSPKNGAEKGTADHPMSDNANSWDHSGRGGGKGSPQAHGGGSSQRGNNGNRRPGNNGARRNLGKGSYDDGGYYQAPMGRELHNAQTFPPLGVPQMSFMPIFPSPTTPPPLPGSPYFIPPQQMQTFSRPMMYHEMVSPMPPPMYYVAQPTQFIATAPSPPPYVLPINEDPRLRLMKQIEFYFSSENLCKDTYLRMKMDEHGWVPLSEIASFKKVKAITQNIQFIVEALRPSNELEVQDEKVRKRNDWKNWVLPHSVNHYSSPTPLPPSRSAGSDANSSSTIAQAHDDVLNDKAG